MALACDVCKRIGQGYEVRTTKFTIDRCGVILPNEELDLCRACFEVAKAALKNELRPSPYRAKAGEGE